MAWARRVAWVVLAILGLWLVAWLAVPPLVKWQAETRLTGLLGRSVTLGEVRFKPWTLELTLSDLAIAGAPAASGEAAAAEPLLHVARLHANLSISSVLRLVPVVQALSIDAPSLRVARLADGRYDVDDVLARLAAREEKPAGEEDEPAQFALYNLQLRDGSVRFDDRPVGRVHEVEALQLSLPFASSLPAEVELQVKPHLSFRLNGTSFDSGAQATPFAPTNEGSLALKIDALDVGPYLGYVPASLPVRLARGTLSAQLALQFALPANGAPGAPSATLRGWVSARDVAVNDAAGAPLLAWREARLALEELQPFARRLAFESLQVDGARLHAARDAQGRLNLSRLAAPGPDPQAKPPAARPAASAASAGAAGAASARSPWRLSLAALELTDARLLWNDAAVAPAAALQLDGVALSATRLQWPLAQPAPLSLSGRLQAQAGGEQSLGQLAVEGQATDAQAKLAIELSGLQLQALAPYVAQVLTPRIGGQVSAKGSLDWSNAPGAKRLRLTLDEAALQSLTVRDDAGRGRRDDASLERLALADVQVDVPARRVVLGRVTLTKPFVSMARDAQGRLDLAGWLAAPEADGEGAGEARASAAPPWQLQLRRLAMEDGRLRLSDATAARSGGRPLRLELAGLRVALEDAAWPAPAGTPPARLALDARVGAAGIARDASRPAGTVGWKGEVALAPLHLRGRLRVVRLPVEAFVPYIDEQLPVAVVRAEAGYDGTVDLRLQPAGPAVQAQGNVLLGDVQVNTLADPEANADAGAEPGSEELLNWQSLAFRQARLSLAPGTKPQVDIAEIVWSEFYSRLVVTEDGHFNLQDVGRPDGDAAKADTKAEAAAPAASAPASAPAPGQAASAPGLPLDIRVGTTRFVNGRIDFADHFVDPNYSAALTELHGELGALSSQSREMAPLTLRGRAAGTALLEITGQLNPTVTPPAMDIRARANDLELAPLSPYAGKYAGYAIERGKLSADVHYKIEADGRLEASNRIVINQLSFGERIESPSATKLPVQLAVALLKDRNGVIDINLPVSGNLEDPQFSLGGLIARLIGNLLLKAVTAPFSLLMGGGSADDLSTLAFEPGTATLAASEVPTLDKVAQALTDRPALKLTLTGSADPVAEREAYQRRVIEQRLRDERRREALRAGTAASAPAEALSGEARERAVAALYRATELPDKPRNRFGFTQRLPAAEMEALLAKNVPVTDDAMRELALQRGLAVRDALLAKGLAGERIFLAAPELHGPQDEAKEKDKAWAPRVEMKLSVK